MKNKDRDCITCSENWNKGIVTYQRIIKGLILMLKQGKSGVMPLKSAKLCWRQSRIRANISSPQLNVQPVRCAAPSALWGKSFSAKQLSAAWCMWDWVMAFAAPVVSLHSPEHLLWNSVRLHMGLIKWDKSSLHLPCPLHKTKPLGFILIYTKSLL